MRVVSKTENLGTKGSALQFAMIASAIFSLTAYSLITVSETSTKVSGSFLAESFIESLESTLNSAIHSRRSYFVSSEKQPNSLPKDCLINYKSPSCPNMANSPDRGGAFDLFSSSGAQISGEYSVYGHNCSTTEWQNKGVCKDSNRIIRVSPVTYRIQQQNRAANQKDKFFISYHVVNMKTGKVYDTPHLNKKDYEIHNIYQQSRCPPNEMVTAIGKGGDAVCTPIPQMYEGPPSSLQGDRGVTGGVGIMGPQGHRGPLNWYRIVGCFDGSTLIKMWDGSFKTIKNITSRDQVYNPITQSMSQVASVTVGPELDTMYLFLTSNGEVKVTKNHPILTKDLFSGFISTKLAKEITKNGSVKLSVSVYLMDNILTF